MESQISGSQTLDLEEGAALSHLPHASLPIFLASEPQLYQYTAQVWAAAILERARV